MHHTMYFGVPLLVRYDNACGSASPEFSPAKPFSKHLLVLRPLPFRLVHLHGLSHLGVQLPQPLGLQFLVHRVGPDPIRLADCVSQVHGFTSFLRGADRPSLSISTALPQRCCLTMGVLFCDLNRPFFVCIVFALFCPSHWGHTIRPSGMLMPQHTQRSAPMLQVWQCHILGRPILFAGRNGTNPPNWAPGLRFGIENNISDPTTLRIRCIFIWHKKSWTKNAAGIF